ncbi:MAG TPA: hypothetical protein VN654_04870 [Vicinamibacterales bacterium]|nr:hypothetical protein [Vicinamibacterales bacterium]
MRARVFLPVLLCLVVAIAALAAPLWVGAPSRSARGPRVRPSRLLAQTFAQVLCRPPADLETVDWDSRPFDGASLTQALASRDEARHVSEMRTLYVDLLRRDAGPADCGRIRQWVDRGLPVDQARRELASQPEARRVAHVRRVFVETTGRDPREWDDPALRRWVDSPYTLAEIRSRLVAQRPLVGVHYFAWYQLVSDGWRNDLTTVPAAAPKPAIGRYESSDTDTIAAHIRQIEDAGFDFAVVHVIADSPRTWMNARTFVDRLSGHRLRAAILLDGLYGEDAAAKAMWVRQAKDEFAGDRHYLRVGGEPLVMLFSAPIDFDVPGVALRNVYWTDRYDPGGNTFNPSHRLEPRDWPFWAPTPQPLVNGLVPVLPGYTDAPLGRSRTMVHPRDNGRMYREQWQRALALRPEVILVYSWNEYFEQTAIEPTDAWGDQYMHLSACFIAQAHRGRTGSC